MIFRNNNFGRYERARPARLMERHIAETERKKPPMRKDTCASCKAAIFWAITEANGKPIPIDYAPVASGNVVIIAPDDPRQPLVASMDIRRRQNGPRYVAHFATCPDAALWSKSK